MRWPSFFGRAAAEKGPRTPEARPTGREWASLPAIQRAVGEPELTAPTAAFVGSLAGTHDPDLSLEPLGHNVSLDGPSGLVIGLVRGVDTYSPSSELVGRPRARRDTTVQRRIVDAEETSAPGAVEHAGADPLPEPEVLSFAAIDEPVPARTPLTRLGGPEASAVQRLAMARPVAAETAQAVNGPARAESGPEPAAALVTAQRLTLGQSRRLGLGAPLSNPEASVVQRVVETPALDLAPPAHSARPDQAEAGSELEPPVAQVEGDEIPEPTVARMAPVGGGTIQRTSAPGAGVAPPAGQLTLARPVAGPAAAGPATAMPALQHGVIQRVVATALPPIYPRPAPAATAPIVAGRASLLTVRRAPDSPPMADDGSDPVSVQRLPAVAGGELPDFALSAEPVQALAPAVYRGSMTAAAAHAPGALPPLAPLGPAVQRAPSTAQDFVAFSAFAPPLAHHAAHPAPSVIDAPVQREVAAAESPAALEASAPVAAAAPGAGAAASPAQSDHELDELARKLHDRISLHLRRDLLIQRERAGLVTDLR